MAQQIGSIPEFTQDGVPPEVIPVLEEEVKETSTPETDVEEKDTPELPAEKPGQMAEDTSNTPVVDQSLVEANRGLQEERVKLLKEISELRGQRREIKQDQLKRVEQQIDELKDVNPNDVSLIERVIRSKGYMTKEESNRMFYETVKQEELNKFLDKFPEYKPENDPNDLNWNALQRELGYYRSPENPHQIADLLERSHKVIARVTASAPVSTATRQRQVQLASAGSGGSQRASQSVNQTLDPERKAMLKSGGFSDEDIASMEKRLSA